jgi:probable selenium-dependent hydroxylase accessory protein YqeC
LELYRALGIVPGDVVAFVGAGGKSGAILRLADELGRAGTPVLVVPTTKMFLDEAEQVGPVVTAEREAELREEIAERLAREGAVAAGAALISKDRIAGVDPHWVPALAPPDGVTLVEADGSRRRPLKGMADHEPALPRGATLVVAVGGAGALGEPLDEEIVHRPERFSRLTGVAYGHTITARAFAAALLAGLEKAPEGARKAALIAGAAPGPRMAAASGVARELWRAGVRKVVLTSLPQEKPGRVWAL